MKSARVLGAASWVAVAATAPFGPYLLVLTAAAWQTVARQRHHTALPPTPLCRFVILVPAHDEEQLIDRTVASLCHLDYPPELRRVHVVADNCTDRTADRARAAGAAVHERSAPDDPGKGPALGWLLDRIEASGEPYDAVVVVDADTTVSRNFLRVMDAKLATGATAVQAYYGVRDATTSPATSYRAAALALRHYLRPLGRTAIGGSCGLFGNGMAFARSVLLQRRFSNHLTEDIELQLELLARGQRTAFAPDAVVEAEMPATVEASRTQHERWERGRIELAKRYLPSILRRSITSGPAGRVAYVDAALDQLSPPFSIIVVGTSASAALALVHAAVVRTPAARRRAVAASMVALGQLVALLSALRMVGAPQAVYRSLLGAPRLVAWKLRLWLRMLLRPAGVAWVRTARNDDGNAVA